jgi:hypothetical protein
VLCLAEEVLEAAGLEDLVVVVVVMVVEESNKPRLPSLSPTPFQSKMWMPSRHQ